MAEERDAVSFLSNSQISISLSEDKALDVSCLDGNWYEGVHVAMAPWID